MKLRSLCAVCLLSPAWLAGCGGDAPPAVEQVAESDPDVTAYLEALVGQRPEDEAIADAAEVVGAETLEDAVDLLRAVRELSKDERSRGLATYHLVLLALRGEGVTDDEEVAALTSDLSGRYAAIEFEGRTLLERARARVTGNDAAAATAGEDFDGVPFELADYRGKVVLLSFWGNWCPPCRAMFPHENELARAYRNRPFALVGVNSDSNLEVARGAVQEADLNWRSFFDGGKQGPIATAWDVGSWPHFVLLDADGNVTYRQSGGGGSDELDQRIESLVQAAERSAEGG